jgi:hypothetical protein
MLSHELRNPLASVAGATEALANGDKLSAADRERAQAILRHQVDAMRRLLDGHLALRMQRCKLADIVETALETARPVIERRHHTFELTLPEAPVVLRADPLRLSQVLSNLLVNAAKYTADRGHRALRARVEGRRCVIQVIDDGRHRRGRSAIDVRDVLALGRSRHGRLAHPGHRPRAGTHGRADARRHRHGRQRRPGPRQHLHRHAAPAQRRAGRGRCGTGGPGRAAGERAATGWGSDADRQATASAGFDAHLIKPVTVGELRSLIDGWSPPGKAGRA